jgi:hypothetical protein
VVRMIAAVAGSLGLLVAVAVIADAVQPGYGKRLAFNGGEVYYTGTVTQDEANRLGEYLIECEFFDGNPKSVQLNRTDDGYEMTMRLQDRAVFFNDRELFRFRPDEPADTEETFEETDEEG